jgi:hypothetical protein
MKKTILTSLFVLSLVVLPRVSFASIVYLKACIGNRTRVPITVHASLASDRLGLKCLDNIFDWQYCGGQPIKDMGSQTLSPNGSPMVLWVMYQVQNVNFRIQTNQPSKVYNIQGFPSDSRNDCKDAKGYVFLKEGKDIVLREYNGQ